MTNLEKAMESAETFLNELANQGMKELEEGDVVGYALIKGAVQIIEGQQGAIKALHSALHEALNKLINCYDPDDPAIEKLKQIIGEI